MSQSVVLDKGWCLYTSPDMNFELRKRFSNGWHVIKQTCNPAELKQFVAIHHPDLAPRLNQAMETCGRD